LIHVVTGHICSGKSWYVRQHAAASDVVVDMDRLALALAAEGTEHHDYPQHVRDIARAARWHAIDEAARLHRRGSFDVWIIHAYPAEKDVAIYRRLGASFKRMECDDQTLRARAKAERPEAMRRELDRQISAENTAKAG